MKGFDYLAPSGFYDALRAYRFPDAIIDPDKAAQKQTKAYIHTAYGIMSPIIIEGLTKQGGPLSPVKSTLTTSLGHWYLDNMASSDSGALGMSTKAQKANNNHTPDDHICPRITMVEAMYDSYLFVTMLTTLQKLCLKVERFQHTYGWMTQWAKTKAFVIQPDGMLPTTILLPSITITDGTHPWTISWHDIPLKAGELKSL